MRTEMLCALIALAACAARDPAPKSAIERENEARDSQPHYTSPAPPVDDYPERLAAAQAAANARLGAAIDKRTAECAEKRPQLEAATAELAAAREKHGVWVKANCKPTQRTTVYVENGRAVETSPTLEYVCDGHIVDSTDSARVLRMADHEAYLRRWMKENCPSDH